MGLACVWLGICSEKTYTPFIIGRAFLGIFEAPIESIVPSTVTDIFFLHDRGAKISMYGLSVLGGNELGPLLSAFIIQYLSMSWAFYIVAAFIGLNLITMIFFMPETKFIGERPTTMFRDPQRGEPKSTTSHVEVAPIVLKKTAVQRLSVLSPADHNVSLRRAFLRPFVLLAYPTVVWSCLVYGMALSWNVILGATVAQIFAPP
jgi:MFS family permease